jgi:hypothetical protein
VGIGVLSSGAKILYLEALHSHSSSFEVKNDWSYTSTPPHACMAWCLVKHQGQLYLLFCEITTDEIKGRRMRLEGHAARMEETRNTATFLSEVLDGRENLADLGAYRRIILKWMLNKYGVRL